MRSFKLSIDKAFHADENVRACVGKSGDDSASDETPGGEHGDEGRFHAG